MPIGPQGQRLPYGPGQQAGSPPSPSYSPKGGMGSALGGPAFGAAPPRRPGRARQNNARPGAQRRGRGGPGVVPLQTATHMPAEVGPPFPAGLADFGALGAQPGIGQRGAVNPGSLFGVKQPPWRA